jgi:Tol biopolymer transport system component
MTLIDRTQPPTGDATARPRRPRRGPPWVAAVIALVVVVLASLGLANFGSKALYIIGGIMVAALVLWSIRDLINPPIVDAFRRVQPKPIGVAPLGKVRTAAGAFVATVAAGILAFAVAGAGTKLLYALVALIGLGVGFWLLWPAVLLLFDAPPDGPIPLGNDGRVGSKEAEWAAIGLGRAQGPPPEASRLARRIGVTLAVVAAGMVAFLAATLGSKALLVLVGVVIVVACLLRARNKSMFAVFGTVCSLAFLEHKSFGAINPLIAGGAPSIYITSFDAMLVVLYAIWVYEGTFAADFKAAVHRRILWIPLIGALLMLPSLLNGGADVHLGVAELVRMAWMYLLFFYVAVRVRTRAMVWAILAGFATFATVELVIILLQWKTGGVLGLGFLGVPTHLSLRITNTADLGRPFGTIIHPDFMGAAMGSLGLVAFALGLTLRRTLTKAVALALSVGCIACLYLAHTRAALVGLVIVLIAMIVVALVHRHLTWKTIGKVVLALMVASAIFFPQIEKQISNNFGTSHFSEEVTSRYQLNDVAGQMFNAHPLIGVGLNSFQPTMGPYEQSGVIFLDNPVQNLYLLYLSETGIIGMVGFLLVGVAMYNIAVRLARSRDRLLGGVGLGVSAAMAFLMIEELLTFSLREDVPLSVYWILAGLAVTCYRMSGLQGRRRPRRSGGRAGGRGDDLYVRTADFPAYQVEAPVIPAGLTSRPSGNDRDTRNQFTVPEARGHVVRWRRRRAERRVDQLLLRAGLDATEGEESRSNDSGQDVAATTSRPAGDASIALSGTGDGAEPPRTRRGRSRWSRGRRRRLGVTVLAATIVMGGLITVGLHGGPGSASGPAPLSTGAAATGNVPIAQMRIVFVAHSNSLAGQPAYNGIFTVNGDGTGMKTLVEAPTITSTVYSWPQWALAGTKIVYTVRNGPPTSSTDTLGSYENIWEMNPDGSGARQLTFYKFRVVQPKMSADGTSIIFAGQNPQYPVDAIYKLNLVTLQATNLSQVTQPQGSVDADPKWTPAGNIVMASSESKVAGEEIDEINADGTNRQVLVNDGNFNTDPEVSPDGSTVAYSAFDGPDPTAPTIELDPTNPDDTDLNPAGWHIETTNLTTGTTAVLTQGQACLSATVSCAPGQSSGWKPVYSPDGGTIAWTGRLGLNTTCICAANADGSDPRVLVQSTDLVIQWFAWTAPGGVAPATATPDGQIGAQEPTTRLLITGKNLLHNTSAILNEPDDMMGDDDAGSAGTSDPIDGRWNNDRSEFVFTANATYNIDDPTYGPPPPAGQTVHEHFTLQEIHPGFPRFPVDDIPPSQQVFLHEADGTNVQLTNPFTEDWRDALDAGDARSNTDPVLSPNGQYVVFTDTSSITGESFLLSLDIATGAVLNLTNGTAGAEQVNDQQPAWSPDSQDIAFTTTLGGSTEVYVMNATDGTKVTTVTDDNAYDMDPAWSPDGQFIVYSHYDAPLAPTPGEIDSLVNLPRSGWTLNKVDVATGQETVLTSADQSPTWRPVFSPDGSEINFVGWQYQTTDLFQTSANGGAVTPLLITPAIDETSVDWK